MTAPDLSDLPAELAKSMKYFLGGWKRVYVAWHPDEPCGLLRTKDPKALAEWKTREWRFFQAGRPTISDVTESLPDLWRAILRLDAETAQNVLVVFDPPATLTLKPHPFTDGDGIDVTYPTLFLDVLTGTDNAWGTGNFPLWNQLSAIIGRLNKGALMRHPVADAGEAIGGSYRRRRTLPPTTKAP